MKIAWLIQGPFWTSSAYYQQIYLFSNYLHDFGIESAVVNPLSFEENGDEAIKKLKGFAPDVVVSFGDVQPFALSQHTKIPNMAWFLNGGGPIPEVINSPGVTIASVSRYCQQRVIDEIDMPSLYVPHAIDIDVFHPGRKKSARARLEVDHEGPLVSMVGTNYGQGKLEPGPDRKNWLGALEAFADLLKERPDAKFYAHTNETGAINIPEKAKELGIYDSLYLADQDHFHVGSWDYPPNHVADVYRAADVLLFPSLAEGFGVPIIEAQACGTPVVATNGGPMSELIITGTPVELVQHPEAPDWFLPDRQGLVDGMKEWIDRGPQDNWKIAGDISQFSVEAVVEDYFIPALKIAAEVEI